MCFGQRGPGIDTSSTNVPVAGWDPRLVVLRLLKYGDRGHHRTILLSVRSCSSSTCKPDFLFLE